MAKVEAGRPPCSSTVRCELTFVSINHFFSPARGCPVKRCTGGTPQQQQVVAVAFSSKVSSFLASPGAPSAASTGGTPRPRQSSALLFLFSFFLRTSLWGPSRRRSYWWHPLAFDSRLHCGPVSFFRFLVGMGARRRCSHWCPPCLRPFHYFSFRFHFFPLG